MKSILIFALICSPFLAMSQSAHQQPTHNFTVQRLILLNDQNEMLMVREQQVWVPPSYVFEQRQSLKQSLDSLALSYGLEIKQIELKGQFSYLYDYHPHATMRNFYMAKYASGQLKTPAGMDEAKWVPIEQAIEMNTVTSIKQSIRQIIENPQTIWGASFMVSHVGDEHPTQLIEPFYALNGQ